MPEPLSLLVQQKLDEFQDSERPQTRPGVVPWSPPQPNWNPWIGANIDEGPLSVVSTYLAILCVRSSYWTRFMILFSLMIYKEVSQAIHLFCEY